MRPLAIPILAGLALAATAALAEPAARPPSLNHPCAAVYVAATVLSDYRFDGFSESNRRPTWQGIVYCYRTDGWYGGVELTGVDFLDQPRTRLETDVLAGRHIAVKGSDLNLGVLYTVFPDKRAPGPSYDMVALQAELSHTVKKLTLKGEIAWLDYLGPSEKGWHAKGTAEYAATPWLKLSGHIGEIWVEDRADRPHWDVGATATWRRLSLDLRYGGTDLKPAQCYFTRWCSPGPSVGVTYTLSP